MVIHRAGMVALVLLVVASTITTGLAKPQTVKVKRPPSSGPTGGPATKKPRIEEFEFTHGKDNALTKVAFNRMNNVKTNGWIASSNPKTVKHDASSVPDLRTITEVIDFIRSRIDSKKDKKFYIGRGSYRVEDKDANTDPASSTAIRQGQIGALSQRFDQKKIEEFDPYLIANEATEMVLVYDTVMDPKKDSLKDINDVRSHGTMEALLLHIFCKKPPTHCQKKLGEPDNHNRCEYFPAGSHNLPRGSTTKLRDILSKIKPTEEVKDRSNKIIMNNDIEYYHNRYPDFCANSVAGTVNGGLNADSNRNRGVVYFVSLDQP